MQNLLNDLTNLLEHDDRLVVEGKLLRNKIVELALALDPSLIKLLLKHSGIKNHFFVEVEGVLVFDKIKFQQFVSNKQFLPDNMPRLFSYKLSHDTGFAPNPFWGVLTLATCKPLIRKYKRVGDWIAGFTSRSLCNEAVGEERLIFLMKAKHKLSIADFFNSKDYVKKIPDMSKADVHYKCGDNIYQPDNKTTIGFKQLLNPFHNQENIHRDLSGESVLISEEFYYFGVDAIEIPRDIRPLVPRGQSASGSLTDGLSAQLFIDWIKSKYTVGRHGKPHSFPASSHITGDNNRSCGNKRP